MTSPRIDTPRAQDDPVLDSPRPPRGVRSAVAGLSCGRPGHVRELIRANGVSELRNIERRWQCPTPGCGAPAIGEGRYHRD